MEGGVIWLSIMGGIVVLSLIFVILAVAHLCHPRSGSAAPKPTLTKDRASSSLYAKSASVDVGRAAIGLEFGFVAGEQRPFATVCGCCGHNVKE